MLDRPWLCSSHISNTSHAQNFDRGPMPVCRKGVDHGRDGGRANADAGSIRCHGEAVLQQKLRLLAFLVRPPVTACIGLSS